ncbi:MAG TPA: VOC family protein [Propionibacteriaceae bacterium]
MSRTNEQLHPPQGQIGYLQLPARELAESATFYGQVFGWKAELASGSFEAPEVMGQWTTDRPAAPTSGPVLWLCADELWPTLNRVVVHGGTVSSPPQLDQGERWLVEVDDPAGNRIGVVVPVRASQPQPMIAVDDVEAASLWYRELFGWQSDHGGAEYERLVCSGVLVLQLHHKRTEHHHGLISDPDLAPGNGTLLWFGEVADFDDVVRRATALDATVVRPPHRNPPAGQGNGPSHRELWLTDLDGYTVVVASPDGEAYELP